MNNLIDGKKIADDIKDKIKLEIDSLDKKPSLAVVLVGEDVASTIYVKNKALACEYVGIKYTDYHLKEETSHEELMALIDKLNEDEEVNGILVQLPLPSHINEKEIALRINPIKDVDGLHPYNIGMLSTNSDGLKACTPYGIMELLKSYNVDIKGKNALVIGRSNIVGKPTYMMLLNKDATVTVAHTKTQNLEIYTKQADIIIVATGVANFLKPNMIKDDVVLIDVGMNRIEGKLYGDIDKECMKKAKLITPVPGGVGPMTIAMLVRNCLYAYKLQNKQKEK